MAYLKDSPRNVFQGLTYSEPVPQFVGEVDYTRTLDKLKDISDESEALSGIVKPVENLDIDLGRLQSKMDYYKGNLNTIAENPDLSPHQKLKATRALSQEYIEDVNHGQLGAIRGNYLSRQKDIEDAYKAYNDGKISQNVLQTSLQEAIDGYSGASQREDGTYNRYSPYDKTRYTNPEPIFEELAKGWKEEGFKGVDPNDPSGKRIADWYRTKDGEWMKKVGKEVTRVTEEEMSDVLWKSAMNNQDLRSSLIAETRAEGYKGGLRGEELNAYINDNWLKTAKDAFDRTVAKHTFEKVGYTSDIRQGAREAATGKMTAENLANPTRTINTMTNNPNAIPRFDLPSEQITLDNFLAQRGINSQYITGTIREGNIGSPVKLNTINGETVSQEEYNKAVEAATKEYEGFIQLKEGNVNGFLQNPSIREKFGNLPASIVAATPQGDMTNEQYTKFITDKINQVSEHFKTLPYGVEATSNTDASKKETEQLRGNFTVNNQGEITSGTLGEIQYAHMYLSGEHSDGVMYTLKELSEKLNTKPEIIANSLNKIGNTKGDNPYTPAGREFAIRDSKGKNLKIIVSDDNLSMERTKVNEPFYKAHSVLSNPSIKESEPFNIDLPSSDGRLINVRAKSIGHDMWYHYDKEGNVLYVDNSPSLSNEGLDYLRSVYKNITPEEVNEIAKNSTYGGRYATIKPLDTNEVDDSTPILVSDKDGGLVSINSLDQLISNQDIYRNRSGSLNLSSRNRPKHFLEGK